jgi:hypothetical protein
MILNSSSHRPILRLATLAALFAGTLAWSGCSTMGVASSSIPRAAVAQMSPAPQITTPYRAVEAARRYVRDHPGSDFAVGSGDSMLPLYQDRDVIVLERPALSDLKVGQTVMFLGQDGVPVAHVVLTHARRGWVTMGLANSETDPDVLRESNYMGVVVKAFRPTGSPILAYWASEPKNVYASNP